MRTWRRCGHWSYTRDIVQLRTVPFLDGGVEGVAVEMGDGEIMKFLVARNPH